MDYASELAEIITLIYNKRKLYFFSGNLRKEPYRSIENQKVAFNEIECIKPP
jgi:uroporphyrinogen-III synthase